LPLVSLQVVDCAPRARGDGPSTGAGRGRRWRCSPRTRGWSPGQNGQPRLSPVLPAHAGMVPSLRCSLSSFWRAPRARGDGPRCPPSEPLNTWCSPRTRGWSHLPAPGDVEHRVLPAHAGMVPAAARRPPLGAGAPRARGDGPSSARRAPSSAACSPRTRGWSPGAHQPAPPRRVLPAHAGMVPAEPASPCAPGRAPRARGDGPGEEGQEHERERCSPRTRGWSRSARAPGPRRRVLPAHAGMVPRKRARPGAMPGAPRARGDGPGPVRDTHADGACSPRTRGWSRLRSAGRVCCVVLPAHAGMVPRGDTCGTSATCAPRARGDGPTAMTRRAGSLQCSPRTRGWSLLLVQAPAPAGVLPAHAGVGPASH
jgi:hypothetical protein